jgi:hypothetical protein
VRQPQSGFDGRFSVRNYSKTSRNENRSLMLCAPEEVIESVIQSLLGRPLPREQIGALTMSNHDGISALTDAIGRGQYLLPGQYEQRERLSESLARLGCFSREQ